MSAISTDWAPTEAAAAPKTREIKRSREEEFHSALESYIANYQKRHATTKEAADSRNGASSFWFLPKRMNWSGG